MNLNELYAKTTSWTARHIIQDEIAMSSKNAEASQYIIDKVSAAIVRDLEKRSMSSWSSAELVQYSILTGQPTDSL